MLGDRLVNILSVSISYKPTELSCMNVEASFSTAW